MLRCEELLQLLVLQVQTRAAPMRLLRPLLLLLLLV